MRTTTLMTLGMVAGLFLAACSGRYPSDMASIAAPPASRSPLGPIPGPGGDSHTPQITNPYEGDPVALQEGRRLFVRFNCAGCHGGHAGGGMGPSLRDAAWMYGSTPADVFNSIADGRAHGMPAWGTRLPEQEIWKMVAYISSLRTSREPQPPGAAPSHLQAAQLEPSE